MGIGDVFRKFRKRNEVVDLGRLQKRGILQTRNAEEGSYANLSSSSEKTPSANTGSTGGFDFFSNIASAPSAEVSGYGESSSEDKKKISERIRRISEKLSKVMDRVELLERKIERLERGRG